MRETGHAPRSLSSKPRGNAERWREQQEAGSRVRRANRLSACRNAHRRSRRCRGRRAAAEPATSTSNAAVFRARFRPPGERQLTFSKLKLFLMPKPSICRYQSPILPASCRAGRDYRKQLIIKYFHDRPHVCRPRRRTCRQGRHDARIVFLSAATFDRRAVIFTMQSLRGSARSACRAAIPARLPLRLWRPANADDSPTNGRIPTAERLAQAA